MFSDVGVVHKVKLHIIAQFFDNPVVTLSDEAAVGALELGKREFNRPAVSFNTLTAFEMYL